jgi:hypothetical protein
MACYKARGFLQRAGGLKKGPPFGGPSWEKENNRILCHEGAADNLNNTIAAGALIQIKHAQPDSGTRAFGRWAQPSVPKKQDVINGIRLPVWAASGGAELRAVPA